MLEILGQDGNIEIKNGTSTVLVNQNSETDANGDIIINYQNSSSELLITTSNPNATGVLEIVHTKAIAENTYTMSQLNAIKTLKTKNTITGTASVDKQEQTVVENSSESEIEVKNTVSKAEFTVIEMHCQQ